jgi:hypothetical protein
MKITRRVQVAMKAGQLLSRLPETTPFFEHFDRK